MASETERLDWLIRNSRGVSLWQMLPEVPGVIDCDLVAVRKAIDLQITMDSVSTSSAEQS